MENVISRHRNVANIVVLVFVLFVQVIGLAVQVKRSTDSGSTRLLRVWAVMIVTPLSKAVVHTEEWFSGVWHGYFDLRHVRQENQDLQNQLDRMRIQQVRLEEDANQARRLQILLGFKEQYLSQTLPAQVISTTGSEFSRGVYIDKGSHDGVKQDMPVITPDGILGKVLRVYPTTSLVLEINDPSSGAGVILEKSRLQGILKGNPNGNGELIIQNIMADEKVEVGERVLTSGGDRIFPKGMPVGTVSRMAHGKDIFLDIWVKPAAQLSRAEEVLVVTKVDERTPEAQPFSPSPVRAIDILAERLPTVAPPPKPEATSGASTGGAEVKPKLPGVPHPVTGEVKLHNTAPKPSTATVTESSNAAVNAASRSSETPPRSKPAESNGTTPQ
ncbi:MAG TPA: rod shape-determining protein MreC [Terriglobales bacterium]|nr:rod shape-determining protein MreC [Terriglobales bacterium]